MFLTRQEVIWGRANAHMDEKDTLYETWHKSHSRVSNEVKNTITVFTSECRKTECITLCESQSNLSWDLLANSSCREGSASINIQKLPVIQTTWPPYFPPGFFMEIYAMYNVRNEIDSFCTNADEMCTQVPPRIRPVPLCPVSFYWAVLKNIMTALRQPIAFKYMRLKSLDLESTL